MCFGFDEYFTEIAAMYISVCQQLKDEPYLQAVFIASTLQTLKVNNGMSDKVDFAISHCGKVLRLPSEEEIKK